MANAPISKPVLYKTGQTWVQQREVLGDGTNTFVSQQFLKSSAGVLVKNTASDTATWGLTLDASHASTDEPYSAPFGENHNVLDPLNARFLVNISNATGDTGSGSTTQGDVTIGSSYGLVYGDATNSYPTVQFLNAAETTSLFFRVEEKYASDAAADKNGRVVVSIVATRQ